MIEFKKGMHVLRIEPWGDTVVRYLDTDDKVRLEQDLQKEGFNYKVL